MATAPHPNQPGPAELLAPAGNPDAGYAALAYGADAVYLGLDQFSARAEADNFTPESLREFTAYAHSLVPPRRVYLTLNTLIKEAELPGVVQALAVADDAGVDAVILQDLGVYALARKYFPRLRLHASTQMAVHSLDGARAAARLGFSRVVLARELTADEVVAITRDASLEIETFIHGTLCYSYSGLCLFSSIVTGRSGNRGRCVYSCREAAETPAGRLHPFSLKDLALGARAADLSRTGVSSLKIEGREKSPLYVAATVDYYRKILDTGLSPDEDNRLRARLQTIFARPWTTLFYHGPDNPDAADTLVVGHRGARIGRVAATVRTPAGTGIRFRTALPLERHDGIQIDIPREARPYGFPVDALFAVDPRGTFSPAFAVPAESEAAVALPDDAPALAPGLPVYQSSSQEVKRSYPFSRPKAGAHTDTAPLDVDVTVTARPDGDLARITVTAVTPAPLAATTDDGRQRQSTCPDTTTPSVTTGENPPASPIASGVSGSAIKAEGGFSENPLASKMTASVESPDHGRPSVHSTAPAPSATTDDTASGQDILSESLTLDVPASPARDPNGAARVAETAFSRLGGSGFYLDAWSFENPDRLAIRPGDWNQARRTLTAALAEKRNARFQARIGEITRAVLATGPGEPVRGPDTDTDTNPDTAPEPAEASFRWSLAVDDPADVADFSDADRDAAADLAITILDDPAFPARLAAVAEAFGRDKIRLALPLILRNVAADRVRPLAGQLVRDGYRRWLVPGLGGRELLAAVANGQALDLAADWTLPCVNHCAAEQLFAMGFGAATLSPEDEPGNWQTLLARYPSRLEALVYADLPLFVSAACVHRLIGRCGGECADTDQASASPALTRKKHCHDRERTVGGCRRTEMPVIMERAGAVVVRAYAGGSAVYSETPYSLAGKLVQLNELGLRSGRVDLRWKRRTPPEAVELWRRVRAGRVEGLHGNFTRSWR
ncbi:MAG: U32 family peptidase [Planctomycetaceae bacterium]|nr:U32 family peptidase [Planctomycetaceae bacterium]